MARWGCSKVTRALGWLDRLHGRACRDVLVPDFHLRAKGCARVSQCDPIYLLDFARRCTQRLVVANHHAIVFAVDRKHVVRFARRESQTFALADGEIVDPVVAAYHVAFFVHDFAAGV